MEETDWLKDPLVSIKTEYKYLIAKDIGDEQRKACRTFHYATRLHLEGAEHFLRLVLGVTAIPDGIGLPGYAYKQQKWYLGAFISRLMSAYYTICQELNAVYNYGEGIKPQKVDWDYIKGHLPRPVSEYMSSEYNEQWFKDVRSLRGMDIHQAYIPTNSSSTFVQSIDDTSDPLFFENYKVEIPFYDESEESWRFEPINVCLTYLQNMVEYMRRVWSFIAEDVKG